VRSAFLNRPKKKAVWAGACALACFRVHLNEWRIVMRKLLLAAAVLVATPAIAQVNTGSGNGLVAVNVQNVDILKNFLNDSQVSALNNLSVPVTVEVPIGVAANVCGVDANVLASQRKAGDPVTCTARNGSKALANAVATQKLTQTK
jgi:hypothetical protein